MTRRVDYWKYQRENAMEVENPGAGTFFMEDN